jgi:hypothetical protein
MKRKENIDDSENKLEIYFSTLKERIKYYDKWAQ